MRKWLKRGLWTVLGVAIAASIAAFVKREELARLMAVNSLFSEAKIVHNFSHMDSAFLHVEIPRGDGPVAPLPQGTPVLLPDGAAQWIIDRNITALVVLKDGQITHESYHLGTGAEDRRISWSVAKSFLSMLFGILREDGTIASLDTPVTQYAPSLTGGAYDGATIQDVLQMESGVLFDEDYLDPKSDINRMGRVLALGGTMDGFATGLTERFTEPGTQMQYTSIDTHVLGMVVRGATGRSVVDLMGEHLIGPMGLEAAPYYLTDGEGVAFVLGGLNLRTRDYARMGELARNMGALNGQQIVPAAWVRASTTPSALTQAGKMNYGYQWWMPKDARPDEVMAQGIYGQYIYIDRRNGVVIAMNAADRRFRDDGISDGNIAMFRAIAAAQ